MLKAENVFMNRQPWIESMIYWANVSVHCDENYQILFPPSMHLGFDHHKNYWTSYPIGPRKEEIELLPSQRSKYANDIEGMMDLSWWKNFTIESRSIFGLDPDNAFMAGYDHKKKCGTAHVSNRHITVGKKFFLWGNFPEAQVWDKVLTDKDGPYLELMVGCWSDNQPDYSWIAPYETRKVSQYWFPVKGIGGIKNVTIDGAVNVDRTAKDELLVGFHSTRVLDGCTVTLAKDGKAVFTEKNVKINPDTPWCKPVKVDSAAKDQQFTASIADKDGKVFLSYTPVPPQGDVKLPPKVENPKEPKDYTSAELAYHVGLRLDQFHNGILDPVPYYKRALEIDPDYSKANLAMGVRLAKNGSYAEAKPYLEKAVARATQNHTRALDAAPEYYLALVERALGNLKCAEDLFWRCTWRSTHKKESYVEIARIAALRGDYEEALARINDALAIGQDEAKLWTMKGIFLKKLAECSRRDAYPPAEGCPRSGCSSRGEARRDLAAKNAKIAKGLRQDLQDSQDFSQSCKSCQSCQKHSASLREINDPAFCFEKAIKCDPLEYWAVVEKAFAGGRASSRAAEALAAAEKNRGLKAQQLLECVSDYFGIGAWAEIIELCDAALAKAAAEKPYATEGALPLKDTIAACDSYKNAMFGYFKAYALAKLGKSDMVKDALSAAGDMTTDYCFPSRLEELEVLQWAANEEFSYKTKEQRANTHYYLGSIFWNMDQKTPALASWKIAASLNPKHALVLRCIGFAVSHPGTYFTNTGVPSGIPSREAYDWYVKSLEAEPHFRTLDEAGKLAERLELPPAERLALMEKYLDTVNKYDPCVLRLAYTYNAVGRYAEAYKILTTRRFHVWEGADGLLAPFIEACHGLGKAAMEAGRALCPQSAADGALGTTRPTGSMSNAAAEKYRLALKYFEESTTYPENLQAGRPGDAGIEPKSRYFMAQCKKALGDMAGYKAELENSLKGWIHAGEMDYWRVKALRELGRDSETAPLIAELKQAIKELETPPPTVINAYAKFAGDNSAMERAAKAREKAGALRELLKEIER